MTSKTYQTPKGNMTRSEILARATHTEWTKGEVLELPVVRWYSPELAAEIQAECDAVDPFAGFGS